MGYTHIARGISLLFNIEMPLNFNHPYNATSISDFWKRWHITLSAWLTDYVYFSIGGLRKRRINLYRNLLLTMLIAGIWHGAAWTFVAWGAYHGFFLCLFHLYRDIKARGGAGRFAGLMASRTYHLVSVISTFAVVVGGWVLFRSPDFRTASVVFEKLFSVHRLAAELAHPTGVVLTQLLAMTALLICCFSGPLVERWLEVLYRPLPYWAKVQVTCLVSLICWIYTADGSLTFIYFQF
jgi:alginate O-acetyltransferase complex protein AlgI